MTLHLSRPHSRLGAAVPPEHTDPLAAGLRLRLYPRQAGISRGDSNAAKTAQYSVVKDLDGPKYKIGFGRPGATIRTSR